MPNIARLVLRSVRSTSTGTVVRSGSASTAARSGSTLTPSKYPDPRNRAWKASSSSKLYGSPPDARSPGASFQVASASTIERS